MSDYSETFLDHYRRPRNLGDLEDAAAVAIVHDLTCGDVLRVAIALQEAAGSADAHRGPGGAAVRIREVRCKAYGCAATVAVASVLGELVAGRTLREAAELDEGGIGAALGGLPPGRLHAAVLGREALRAALARLPAGPKKKGATGR